LCPIVNFLITKIFSLLLFLVGFLEVINSAVLSLAICNEELATKLRGLIDKSTMDLIIVESPMTQFEDLEAFWTTNSTLKSVCETRGKCLTPSAIKVVAKYRLVDLTAEDDNDEQKIQENILVKQSAKVLPVKVYLVN
jgi:hypothetical protein